MPSGIVTKAGLSAVWGSSGSGVFAVGYLYPPDGVPNATGTSTIVHYDGASWETMLSGNLAGFYPNGIWGRSATDVFVVGAGGTTLHFDGKSWTGLASGTNSLAGVWGGSANDVFVVGSNGTILHRHL